MKLVKAKKYLGQHFLNNNDMAEKITNFLSYNNYQHLLEIGPGMGILTKHILNKDIDFHLIEIDSESVLYLNEKFPDLKKNIIEGDFLKFDLVNHFKNKVAIIGNFPYNISSQILFRVWENHDKVNEVVGMFQKEVADRVLSLKGRKRGILSVLIQAFFDIEHCLDLEPNYFSPPPKVQSTVIKITRNNRVSLECSKKLFKQIVKSAYNQRRKTLRNALKSYNLETRPIIEPLLQLRAEQLSVDDFIKITQNAEKA